MTDKLTPEEIDRLVPREERLGLYQNEYGGIDLKSFYDGPYVSVEYAARLAKRVEELEAEKASLIDNSGWAAVYREERKHADSMRDAAQKFRKERDEALAKCTELHELVIDLIYNQPSAVEPGAATVVFGCPRCPGLMDDNSHTPDCPVGKALQK